MKKLVEVAAGIGGRGGRGTDAGEMDDRGARWTGGREGGR